MESEQLLRKIQEMEEYINCLKTDFDQVMGQMHLLEQESHEK